MSSADKCECTFQKRLTGDGCRYCNPQYYISILEQQAQDDAVEIERLSKILVAARWVDIHVAAERIPGLIDRQHFGALRAALKEYDGTETTGDSDDGN